MQTPNAVNLIVIQKSKTFQFSSYHVQLHIQRFSEHIKINQYYKPLQLKSMSSSSTTWSCSKCTFINPNSSQPICQICSTPQNTSQPISWSCKSCTFLNRICNTICEICGTRPAFDEPIVGTNKRKIEDLLDQGLDDAAEFESVKSAKLDVVDLGILRVLGLIIMFNAFRVLCFLLISM